VGFKPNLQLGRGPLGFRTEKRDHLAIGSRLSTIRTESLHLAVDRGILTHPGGRRVGLQSSDKSIDAGA
jgi:hypothetical protein